MSQAARRRRELIRWRYRQRYRYLKVERGDFYGFPSDVYEVAGMDPGFPHLRGWVFRCWRYRPCAPNPPYWWMPWAPLHRGVVPLREGDWLLHRVGDGAGVYTVLSDDDYRRWRDWRPDSE